MNDVKRGGLPLSDLTVWNQSVFLLWLAPLLIAMPLTTSALTLGQLDDFQDGTAQGWRIGVASVNNVANGGPAGSGDRYIQYASLGGIGAQSRMIILNDSQWLGDYIGAGITGIAMGLNNLSVSQPLSMRLAFFNDASTGFVSTTPFSLAAGSGWQHNTFSLTAANFTAIGSPGDFNTFLSNFNGQLRILSSSAPSLLGDPVAATLGVDNVQAIPEPSTFVMVNIGLLLMFLPTTDHVKGFAITTGKIGVDRG